jgi:hypothetical protein
VHRSRRQAAKVQTPRRRAYIPSKNTRFGRASAICPLQTVKNEMMGLTPASIPPGTRQQRKRWGQARVHSQPREQEPGAQTRAEEALAPRRSEVADRMRGAHQRGQTATRARPLPIRPAALEKLRHLLRGQDASPELARDEAAARGSGCPRPRRGAGSTETPNLVQVGLLVLAVGARRRKGIAVLGSTGRPCGRRGLSCDDLNGGCEARGKSAELFGRRMDDLKGKSIVLGTVDPRTDAGATNGFQVKVD